jgi:hypothetical protein
LTTAEHNHHGQEIFSLDNSLSSSCLELFGKNHAQS